MTKTRERLEYIDIARGIGLALVVYAHTRAPFYKYINLFHMPFFFFLSGYLYNPDTDIKTYLKKEIKSYYIPFAFWNCAAIIARVLIRNMKARAALKKIGLILLTLDKDGLFLGATWFLGSLFAVSVIYKLLEVLLKDLLKKNDQRHFVLLALHSLAAVFAFRHNLPYSLHRTVILSAFFALGVFLRTVGFDPRKHSRPWFLIITLPVFVLLRSGNLVNMATNEYTSPLKFTMTSLLGSYSVLTLSVFLTSFGNKVMLKIRSILSLIGRRGKDLIIWQFVAFRVMSTVQALILNKPLDVFFKDKAVQIASHGWWIAFFVVGMVLPLLWTDLLRKGKIGAFLTKTGIL